MKIKTKLLNFFFGYDIKSNLKEIVKDKKIGNQEKINQIIDKVENYIDNKFSSDVKFATYEIYYEDFVDDKGNKIEDKYKSFYQYEYDNAKQVLIVSLSKAINLIFEYNDEHNELSHNRLNICKSLKNYNQSLEYFNPSQFYMRNNKIRNEEIKFANHIFELLKLDSIDRLNMNEEIM